MNTLGTSVTVKGTVLGGETATEDVVSAINGAECQIKAACQVLTKQDANTKLVVNTKKNTIYWDYNPNIQAIVTNNKNAPGWMSTIWAALIEHNQILTAFNQSGT